MVFSLYGVNVVMNTPSVLFSVAKLIGIKKVTFYETFIKYHFFDMKQSLTILSKMLNRIVKSRLFALFYCIFRSSLTSVGYLSYCFLKHDEK